MSVPYEVLKFIAKKLAKDSDNLKIWADEFIDTESLGSHFVDRIQEHCEDILDVLKEVL